VFSTEKFKKGETKPNLSLLHLAQHTEACEFVVRSYLRHVG